MSVRCFFLVVTTPCMALAAPGPEQFAYGAGLALEPNRLYEFVIPDYVYENSQQQRLNDVRVFDAAGNVMAQTISKTKRQTLVVHKDSEELTLFPVTENPANHNGNPGADVNMRIKRDAAGFIVDIYNDPKLAGDKAPSWYLVDLGEKHEHNPAFLDLTWDGVEQVKSTVTVATGSDLLSWRRAGTGVIFSLQNGAQKFFKNRIRVDRVERYLKITLPSTSAPVLTGAQVVFQDRITQASTLRWAQASLVSSENNRFEFRIAPGFPHSALRVVPAEENVLQHVQLSGSRDGSHWQAHYNGDIYRLRIEDQEFESDSVSSPGHANWPYWRLEILSSNRAQQQAPRLEFGWHPQKLRFLTGAAGQYTIAFGSASVAQRAPSIPAGIDLDKATATEVVLPEAPMEIGGNEAIRKSADSSMVEKTVLWAVMTVVLLVMGYMALRLIKAMRET